jgi:glycosyltransferase 2 family protein
MSKKQLALILKFGVSAVLIWYLLSYKVDLDAAKARLLEVDFNMVLLAVGLLLIQAAICVMRWGAVLDAIREPLGFIKALKLFLMGSFFSQALPSSVGGDAVRVYKAYQGGLSLSGAVNGVMLERAATVVVIVPLVAALMPIFLTRVDDQAGAWILSTLIPFAVAAIGGLALLMVLDRLPERLMRWRVIRGLSYLATDTRRLFLAPGHTAKALGWAAIGHANIALVILVLARGLDIDVAWIECLVLMPLVLLVTTIPVSIGGWGVREGAMVFAFGLIGVSGDSAVVLSFLFGLLVIAVSIPGGLIWLMSGETRADVIAESKALSGEPGAS